MNIEPQKTLGESLLLFAGCLELYARRDWNIGSKEPCFSPQGNVLPPMSIEQFARCKIDELRNVVDWLSHLISAVLALPHGELSNELGALLLQAKPYLKGNLDAAELSLAAGHHATAIDDVCIRAFGAAYASMGEELERSVARLRVHETRENIRSSAVADAIERERSEPFTLLDRFPATVSGHVGFIEWVCREVGEQAQAAKERKYPDQSLEKQLAQGIKWDEARQRAEALVDWSESAAKPILDILRRELALGTVEHIEELLVPAVRNLREALETERKTPVDGSTTSIAPPFSLGELLREITQRDAYYQQAERVAPKVPPMQAIHKGSAEAIQLIESQRLRAQGDKVHEGIASQSGIPLLRAICESTGERLDGNILRKLRGQVAVALGIGTDDVDAMELKDFIREWRGMVGITRHSGDYSWPTFPFAAPCRPSVHVGGKQDGKLVALVKLDGRDLTVVADNVDQAVELAMAEVRPRFTPSQGDVEMLSNVVRGFEPSMPNWDSVKGTLAGLGIPVSERMTMQEIIAALGVRAMGERPLRPPVEITESLARLRKDQPDISKVCFVVMQFGPSAAHNRILAAIRSALAPHGITALRADDKQYHDDLFLNILTFIHGTQFGIAVFERIENDAFNPNVSLEVGYMLGLGKSVCLLKDRTLKNLQSDLVGRLYRTFDPQDPETTIPKEIAEWLQHKGFAAPTTA